MLNGKSILTTAALLLVAAMIGRTTCNAAPTAYNGPKPVLVELFTSEGCSDCPSADELLSHLTKVQPYNGIVVVGLEEHINYWNSKRWGDPFSSTLLTNRQYAYASHFNDNSVYTPEMVVDGNAHFVGSDSDSASSAIRRASEMASADLKIAQAINGDVDNVIISVSNIPLSAPHDLHLIAGVTEDGIHSYVPDGENKGLTLPHSSVVRELSDIGIVSTTSGDSFNLSLPVSPAWSDHPLFVVAFLQSASNLRVYGCVIADFK